MGLYFSLFNFTIVFTRRVLIMNQPKMSGKRRFYGDHNQSKGRGSTPTLDMLLCPWIRYFTIFVAAWWLEQAAANSTKDKKSNLGKVNSKRVKMSNLSHSDTTRFLVNGR